MMDDQQDSKLVFFINGVKQEIETADPQVTLLQYIRTVLQLTGSKLSCGQGSCGACTVMVSEVNRKSAKISHYTVNACIYPVVQTHGKAVTTVEGIGSTRTTLHPVQERLAKCHGTQCGFCSPGMVMSMYTLLRNNSKPTDKMIEEAIQGNLCRCTGYRPILESFKTFTQTDTCPMGKDCCKNSIKNGAANHMKPDKLLYDMSSFMSLETTQELIFPNELQLSDQYEKENLKFSSNELIWYRPSTLEHTLELVNGLSDYRLTMGFTRLALNNLPTRNIISIGHLHELHGIKQINNHLMIGASTTLSELENYLKSFTEEDGKYANVSHYSLLATFRNWRSGTQIKNVATIGGNLMTGNSKSNFIPMLMLLSAEAVIHAQDGTCETLTIDNSFMDILQSLDIKFILKAVKIPLQTFENEFVGLYSALQQSHVDGRSSIVSAAFKIKIMSSSEDKGNASVFSVERLCCAFGGVHGSPVIYNSVLPENTNNGNLLEQTKDWFDTQSSTWKTESYALSVASNFFVQFHHNLLDAIKKGLRNGYISDNTEDVYTIDGVRVWEPQTDRKSVGQPLHTQWAMEHATGEAKYVMDMPQYKDELHMALVTSTKAHAKIISVDPSPALQIPGVVDFISHKDIPGENTMGIIGFTEEVFAVEKVTCVGHTIGGVLAKSAESARKGAKAVLIRYKELPAIFTIKEALEKESYLGSPDVLQNGDTEEGFGNSEHCLEGEIELGGQEHYYLETQSSLVVPKQEYQQFDVFSSTQGPNSIQSNVAQALGIPQHKIHVHVRRLGGGFGGKELRSLLCAVPAAIAAYKRNCPVRLTLDRSLDMQTTGGRHPCYSKYKVGFDREGRIKAFQCDFCLAGGNTPDLTFAILQVGLLAIDNCYHIPNIHVKGYQCKTNFASNTGTRGFGAPQSSIIMNVCLERMAKYLCMDMGQVQLVNMYKDGDQLPYKQIMDNCNIKKCWDTLLGSSDYNARKKEIAEFNQNNILMKKGLAMIPVKFPMSAAPTFLNQGAALVNIYQDGSVLVHSGAVEMGQGVNIKIMQIASETLGIPISQVIIDETSTNIVPNTMASGTSITADLFGGAVKNACDKLIERLQPIKDKQQTNTWKQWIITAFMERISLSATGFYRIENTSFDEAKYEGHPFNYFTFGAACSEVQLDVLTGEHKLLKTDIVFDIGKSINPAIDIGQIEGGFMQGYGYYCLEELLYSPDGRLLSTSGSNYRVPTVKDIPPVLNVTLLKDHPNEKAVYSSKGIGEPPLLLGASVYFAIKDAITSVRIVKGFKNDFQLDCPATPARVLSLCQHD